ncbi:hypothetical protein [Blastococcus atacamensis]|uniref:hypothetical protein n=1 Tax=Blastococcus atacamensis TaxID=2070508 RepID=UPI0012FFED35|nr:hypothetical protein [Blastococcus atacamensis]
MTLAEAFQRACEDAVVESQRLGYTPTAWMSMMHGPGGAVAAARRLLTSGDVQTGFERLVRIGRRDLTVEAAVLDERWADLFDEPHRAAARWRLSQVDGTGQP